MMAKSFALPIKEVSSRSRRLKVNSAPWEELKGQIYLGGTHLSRSTELPIKDLKEIPLAQLRAAKPSLGRIFAKAGIER